MREIKFRAWAKNLNKMVEVDAIAFQPLWVRANSKGGYFGFNADEFDLMQFTGLKDKNGEEIYEGDILFGTLNPKPTDSEKYVSTVKVEWSQRLGAWTANGHELLHQWLAGTFKDRSMVCEVIGNIYENLELLK